MCVVENSERMSLSPRCYGENPRQKKGRKNPWQESKKLLQSAPILGEDEAVKNSSSPVYPVLLRPASGGFSFC
jgi:hypothetical protein